MKLAVGFGNPMIRELIEAGIIPKNCSKFSLIIDAASVVTVRSEVFIEEEDFRKIADALLRSDEEGRQLAAEITGISKERAEVHSVVLL